MCACVCICSCATPHHCFVPVGISVRPFIDLQRQAYGSLTYMRPPCACCLQITISAKRWKLSPQTSILPQRSQLLLYHHRFVCACDARQPWVWLVANTIQYCLPRTYFFLRPPIMLLPHNHKCIRQVWLGTPYSHTWYTLVCDRICTQPLSKFHLYLNDEHLSPS